ncbi:MAG: hypothetical protein SFY68_11235 [Candidatus Sumerlaeia bacterium]|nr:hypothetical protein [Candidatus Sumerlaeia bacterium]
MGNIHAIASQFTGEFSTLIVEVPKAYISHFCSTMEAFDNLALVRTREPGSDRLWIYTNTVDVPLVKRIIAEFQRDFPIRCVAEETGMKGLDDDDNWN